jgi:hypothetical protein
MIIVGNIRRNTAMKSVIASKMIVLRRPSRLFNRIYDNGRHGIKMIGPQLRRRLTVLSFIP